MVKVIETNVSLYPNGEMADFQSRVIEVESWESIVEEVRLQRVVIRNAWVGNLQGTTMPKMCKIKHIEYNEHKLQCLVELYSGRELLKLLYLT